jgi:hypothetical protein
MFRAGPVARNDNRPRLDRASWQAKAGILALAAGTGLITFITLPERGSFSLTVGLTAALLAIVYFLARDLLGGTRDAGTAAAQASQIAFVTRLRGSARQPRVGARAEPGAQSAAGFLARFRRSLELAESEAEETAKEFGARGFARFRFSTGSAAENDGNDLRHYLNKRLAASQAGTRKTIAPKHDAGAHVLKSLDAVLEHIARQDAGVRALLVGGAAAIDATAEAISIARALVAAGHQVVLLDLAHGPHSISAALGLPRFPGLTDLAAGRAQFEEVIALDGETPLHVIPAGNPRFAAGDGNGRFAAILAALTEAYDSIVLHADREALRRTAPDLGFGLSIAVAVLPQRASGTADLSGFAALNCQTLAYEQASKRRPRFLGWAAAL